MAGDLKSNEYSWHEYRISKIKQSADKGRILRDRALTLAKRPLDIIQEFQTIEVLVFALGEEKYAVGSETVREVCPLKQITHVPVSRLSYWEL